MLGSYSDPGEKQYTRNQCQQVYIDDSATYVYIYIYIYIMLFVWEKKDIIAVRIRV